MASCIPVSDTDWEDIFQYPFTVEDETIDFIKSHGRIMFILRGPPGTGKNSLSKMLLERYPSAVVCSADSYFSCTFASPDRNKDSVAKSHAYCRNKVKKECEKGTHPIIVQNTHMNKSEMQEYLDFAAKYNYIIVMAITLHKFKVTPQILVKSNTKGLTEEYFVNRLKQWQNVAPMYTAWFISPKDSTYLLSQLQSSLDALLDDGKFCRIFNVFEKDAVLKYFNAKKLLYCVAGYGKCNCPQEICSYYLSDNIKNCYGRSYTITIQAFLVTTMDILAVVHLKDSMKELMFQPKVEINSEQKNNDLENITSGLQAFSVNDNIVQHSKTINLNNSFSNSAGSAKEEDWQKSEIICLKDCSFIHLAEKNENVFYPWKLNNLLHSALMTVADENGKIKIDQFTELGNNFEVCRLTDEAWLVKLPSKISMKTIFTGLYI